MIQGRCEGAFTLIELLIVVGVIAILAALSIPAMSSLRARAERVQCTANLRTLGIGANLFIQQNGAWPQIPAPGPEDLPSDYAKAWIAALQPFSVPSKIWICPAMQVALGNPDYLTSGGQRIDYFATSFDDKPASPHEWPRQPWFIENGDVHGDGNLILFTDGSISDLTTVVQRAPTAP